MALSVDDLCLRASRLTSLSDAAGGDDRELLDAWVNEAIAKVFQDTQCVVTKVNATLAAEQDEYALDRGVMTVLNYGQTSASTTAKLTVINAAEMIERRFLAAPGTVRYFCVFGGNLLVVSPAPTTDQVISFYAVPVPDLVATTDDIFVTGLPTYAQRAVEAWLYARCFEQVRDYKNAQYWDYDSRQAPGQYQLECSKIKITNRRQGGRTLPAGRIGYPDQISTPSRNDQYPQQH